MAHARRKFVEAPKVQSKGKTLRADIALTMISKLYGIESELNIITETRLITITISITLRTTLPAQGVGKAEHGLGMAHLVMRGQKHVKVLSFHLVLC